MTITKEIIYPIFLKCCEFTTDVFWENVFEDLAYGKTPYGTYISKDCLCCGYKDKEFSYKIDSLDAEKIYNDIYSLLVNKLGLLSQIEKSLKRDVFHNIEEDIKNNRTTWSSIRKKNIKDILIENYVIDMKNKYSLTITQSKYLLSVIVMSMIFKSITSSDIDYSDGKINKIHGIEFSKGNFKLEKDMYTHVSMTPILLDDKKLISENWEKYLTALRKTYC